MFQASNTFHQTVSDIIISQNIARYNILLYDRQSKGAITSAAHCHNVNVLLSNSTFLFLLFSLCVVGRVSFEDFFNCEVFKIHICCFITIFTLY